MEITREQLELLGAEAIKEPVQTALMYSAQWYSTTVQYFVLGGRTWVRRSKGAGSWTQWRLDGSYHLSGGNKFHAEAAVLIPLSAAQATRAAEDNSPPGKSVRFGSEVLEAFRLKVTGMSV